MNTDKGFSLIELIVVMAIIGIITTIAIPSYQRNVLKSARGEGMTDLLDIMRSQENFFANSYTYTDDLRNLGFTSNPANTSNGNYSVIATECSGTLDLTQCVLLIASPLGSQIDDGPLTLNSRGARSHDGSNGWIR